MLRSWTVSPDGERVAVAGESNDVVFARSGEPVRHLDGHATPVTSLSFALDGNLYTAGGVELIEWDRDGKLVARVVAPAEITAFEPVSGAIVLATSDIGPEIKCA